MSDEWRAELYHVFRLPGFDEDPLEAVCRYVLRDPHRWRQLLNVPYPAVEVYPPVTLRFPNPHPLGLDTEDARAIAKRAEVERGNVASGDW